MQRKNHWFQIFVLGIILITDNIFAQHSLADLKLVFYNVENFYDWKNDPTINDEEFLPEGSRRWSKSRFEDKAMNIYKVFSAIGEFEFPAIIGMAEVENAFVLDYLMQHTPMSKVPLAYVHKDSPDPRGIDACILYRTDKLKLIKKEFIALRLKNQKIFETREIVYASFQTSNKEVLHVFVNHWPSRRGGELETQNKRGNAATVLRDKIDSIFKIEPRANIILTGDFNDEPISSSITKLLNVQQVSGSISSSGLYNLSSDFEKRFGVGTLKFRGDWSVFDQIIVSGALLNGRGLKTCTKCAGVFKAPFLLTEDKTHMGFTTRRTYNGLNYNGGYSDHLPVFLDISISRQ